MRGQYPSTRILQLIYHLPNFAKLFWRLFRDPRVPAYRKALPFFAGIACLAYVVFPFDVLPDFPFNLIGQLDDTTVVMLIMVPTIWLFVRTCPKQLVKEHSRQIDSGG